MPRSMHSVPKEQIVCMVHQLGRRDRWPQGLGMLGVRYELENPAMKHKRDLFRASVLCAFWLMFGNNRGGDPISDTLLIIGAAARAMAWLVVGVLIGSAL